MAYCGRCGSELEEGANVCPVCGAVQGEEGRRKRKGYGKEVPMQFEKRGHTGE